jgi:hypothetical protein
MNWLDSLGIWLAMVAVIFGTFGIFAFLADTAARCHAWWLRHRDWLRDPDFILLWGADVADDGMAITVESLGNGETLRTTRVFLGFGFFLEAEHIDFAF